MSVGFDVISDLALGPEDNFNWEGKSQSLYCLVAGNISNDLRTIQQTLTHLSHFYQGVFYITGALEYENVTNIAERAIHIGSICGNIRNVSLLYNHVVIIDGVAILGANCWYGPHGTMDMVKTASIEAKQLEDISYLHQSIERLQLHLDVKKIIVVTHSVPGPELYFGEEDNDVYNQVPPNASLSSDTMNKVTHWVFGSYNKEVDTVMDGVNYINNAYFKRNPYWAKRINV